MNLMLDCASASLNKITSAVGCCLALLRFNAIVTDQTDIKIMLACGLRLFDLLSLDVILLLLIESK